MKADGAWERTVQVARDHANACQGALYDVVLEWSARADDTASRQRVGDVLDRAKLHARKLVEVLDRMELP